MSGTTSTAAASLLSEELLHAALLERHAGAKSFPDRDKYVGASEVGSCLRSIAYRKLHPEANIFAPDAAGRMRAGQVMEAEVVAMIRLALKGHLRETGANQSELHLAEAPVRCHPDGRILSTAIDHLRWSQVAALLVTGVRVYLEEVPSGEGALEIKTASSHQLRKFQKKGLSLAYMDQTQVEMACMGVSWGLLIVVSRENLSEFEVFFLSADPVEVDRIRGRALLVMSAVDGIRSGLISEEAGLPGGETDRGYCQYCPISDTCPSMIVARSAAGPEAFIPPDEVDDFEAMVEEYRALQPDAKRFEVVKDLLKDRSIACGFEKAMLPSGILLALSERQGRETADVKALKTKFPEVAAQVVSRGESFHVLSVKEGR